MLDYHPLRLPAPGLFNVRGWTRPVLRPRAASCCLSKVVMFLYGRLRFLRRKYRARAAISAAPTDIPKIVNYREISYQY